MNNDTIGGYFILQRSVCNITRQKHLLIDGWLFLGSTGNQKRSSVEGGARVFMLTGMLCSI